VLGFVRAVEGEKVLCIFNLGTAAVTAPLPPGMHLTPLEGHGFTATLHPEERTISLNGRDAFFARIA